MMERRYAYVAPQKEQDDNTILVGPWLGITAYVGTEPYLIVGYDGSEYELENQNGAIKTAHFVTSDEKNDWNYSIAIARLALRDTTLDFDGEHWTLLREGAEVPESVLNSITWKWHLEPWQRDKYRTQWALKDAPTVESPNLDKGKSETVTLEYKPEMGYMTRKETRVPLMYLPQSKTVLLGVPNTYHQDMFPHAAEWAKEKAVEFEPIFADVIVESENEQARMVYFHTEAPLDAYAQARENFHLPVYVQGMEQPVAKTQRESVTPFNPNPGDLNYDAPWDYDQHLQEVGLGEGECPMCGSANLNQLGNLGGKKWLRCNNCGIDFSPPGQGVDQSYNDALASYQAEIIAQRIAEQKGVSDREDTRDPLKCSECDSHSIEIMNVDKDGEAICRCRACGHEFDHENFPKESAVDYLLAKCEPTCSCDGECECEDDCPCKKRRHASFADNAGNPLEEGRWYTLHGKKYRVPDVVRVVTITPESVVATFEGDADNVFPLKVSVDDVEKEGYTFEPFTPDSPIAIEGMWKEARSHLTKSEQQELINEEGEARNKHKLNLEGTHYTTNPHIESYFLW